jgi:hypothetical protein
MRRTIWILVAAGAFMVALGSSVGPAAGSSSKQRVVIMAPSGGDINSFVLKPLQRGPLARDSGGGSWCCWKQVFKMRDGQKVEVNDPTLTLTGDQGTLVLQIRIDWVDAGNGYSVGTGPWKVVSGTGGYAHVKGGGQAAHLWIGPNPTSWRLEGYLAQK